MVSASRFCSSATCEHRKKRQQESSAPRPFESVASPLTCSRRDASVDHHVSDVPVNELLVPPPLPPPLAPPAAPVETWSLRL